MTAGCTTPRVVVTGLGVVSPIGIGKDRFWENLLAGKSGIDYLSGFPNLDLPTKLAAEVRDFDPLKFVSHRKMLKVMSRDIQLGVAAASLAMEDGNLQRGDFDPERLGVEFGAGSISIMPSDVAEAASACMEDDGFNFDNWGEAAMQDVHPLWLLRHLPNMAACHVAIEHDARGPNNTITSRDCSALLALDEAVRVIQRGAADAMVVGASSSNIHPLDITRMSLYDNLSRRSDDPTRASRPFDRYRDGSIVGEGSAAFLIETYEHAVARGAEIYAEILGVGAGCDGRGYANGSGGTGIVRAVEAALRKSMIRPAEIGHINAHGKSTQRDDSVEARAYHRALGTAAETIPVVGMKSYFGTFDAGAGAVELAGSILAVHNKVVPMTLNYEAPDPNCRLNVVHSEPHFLRTQIAMSVNRTDMGQSAAAILRAV